MQDLGYFKCNSYGASKGNPEPSSRALFISNDGCNLIYVDIRRLGYTTNLIS